MADQPIIDFSFASYTGAIEKFLDNGYSVGSFIDLIDSESEKQLILRHDLDNSLEQALRVARLESELGVTATYFLRVHARGYNLFDFQSLKGIEELRELGHEVELHVEGAINEVLGIDLDEFLDRQRAGFEAATGQAVVGISLHEPARLGRYGVGDHLVERWGLRYNAYQERFFNGEYKYLSDSSGRWREGHFVEWVNKADKLQVLTHPFWWFEQVPQEVY